MMLSSIRRLSPLISLAVLISSASFAAEPLLVDSEDLTGLYRTLNGVNATELTRSYQGDDGFLHYVGAPPGSEFTTDTSLTKATVNPGDVAKSFINTHRGAFGAISGNTTFDVNRVRTTGERTYVTLHQRYGGLEVFGGAINVQLTPSGGVVSVLSDIMRQTGAFDEEEVSLVPATDAAAARRAAIEATASTTLKVFEAELETTTPTLLIYDPAVVGNTGASRLAWRMTVSSSVNPTVKDDTFVDAHTGEVIFQYTLIHTARFRAIFDAANEFTMGELVRLEGEPPTGIIDADNAYDFLGDTYDFYFEQHGRDGITGFGDPLVATVRFGSNFLNAFWDGFQMVFGDGFTIDDVTAHELTHGVTNFSSNLFFFAESGAINESFSDIWGEFVDLTNGRGVDGDEVRWLIGEELPASILPFIGTVNPPARALRNMQNPPEFTWFPFDRGRIFVTPDRFNHPDFYRGFDDNGGVHFNSGVGNKLAYLLTDGDTFNGRMVRGMGIERVADLLYECQINLLTPASDYFDFFFALGQAGINLGFTEEERFNVRTAAEAVEINPPSFVPAVGDFRALSADALDLVQLTWKRSPTNTVPVRIVRRQGIFPVSAFDGQQLTPTVGVSVIDSDPLALGQEYFYGIFSDDLVVGFPALDFYRVTVGDAPPNFLTETFTGGVDISSTQILFTPRVDLNEARISGQPQGFVNYTNYEATVIQDPTRIFELPIRRDDEQTGGPFDISFTDNGIVFLALEAPFPFFGIMYNTLFIGSNGYISFASLSPESVQNFPSTASHFDLPRISVLFADLAPNIAGAVWAKVLDDRVVVTFENIAEFAFTRFGFPRTSTAQAELFFSGHIRLTYLDVNVQNAVVGLSDGRGIPVDPSNFFLPPNFLSDFSQDFAEELSPGPAIWPPVPAQFVEEGDLVEFTVHATSSTGAVPSLDATWDRDEPIDFSVSAGDGSGIFRWQTAEGTAGVTNVLVRATLGGVSVTQNVPIIVSNVNQKPQALNLLLRTNEAGETDEDAAQSRTVAVESKLIAEFIYFHPQALELPNRFGEGDTILAWVRNGVLIPSLLNRPEVPPNATQIGDTWSFFIIPLTLTDLVGLEARSPIVTIEGRPIITSVDPDRGKPRGGEVVTIRGTRLSAPESVTFGGIPALNVRSISSAQMEVETPPNFEGPVDVIVTTFGGGSTTLANGFTYTPDVVDKNADVNDDGVVNATDLQIVIVAVAEGRKTKSQQKADINLDGSVNSLDIQTVINEILRR